MRKSSEQSETLEFDPTRIRQRFAAAFKPSRWIFWSDMGSTLR